MGRYFWHKRFHHVSDLYWDYLFFFIQRLGSKSSYSIWNRLLFTDWFYFPICYKMYFLFPQVFLLPGFGCRRYHQYFVLNAWQINVLFCSQFHFRITTTITTCLQFVNCFRALCQLVYCFSWNRYRNTNILDIRHVFSFFQPLPLRILRFVVLMWHGYWRSNIECHSIKNHAA